MLAGLKANFKGSVAGEEYTKWPDQLDFSVELAKARAAKPDAVFAFYPGAAGIQFLTQYAQAGLKAQIPLYTAFVIDALSLPRLNDLAMGVPGAQHWVNDLPNAANQKFVADFRAKYRRYPSFYAAQAYDPAKLIDSAVAAVKGDLTKRTRCARRCALELRLGARPLPLRQQSLPDPEFLSAGGGQGCKRDLHPQDGRHRVAGPPGSLSRTMPDEVTAA